MAVHVRQEPLYNWETLVTCTSGSGVANADCSVSVRPLRGESHAMEHDDPNEATDKPAYHGGGARTLGMTLAIVPT